METFTQIKDNELENVDGGVALTTIVIGGSIAGLVGGFGTGYIFGRLFG